MILLAMMYTPVIIFAITALGLNGRLKVLNSSLMLVTSILMGLSIIGVYNFWIIYQQWAPAFLSIGALIFTIWMYVVTKGKEKQIILAVNEEIRLDNYNITPHDLSPITYDEIGRTIEILKSKGLISHKVVYIDPAIDEVAYVKPEAGEESLEYEQYLEEDSTGDPISNFERRHNLRR